MSPAAAAAILSSYLKDLISAGHLSPEKSYLACDPSKLYRARKKVMADSRCKDKIERESGKIKGMSYDGRKDRVTRVMVCDSLGKKKIRVISEEHESVTEEPSGMYLTHFVPKAPIGNEKPALKVAQGLLGILEENDSIGDLEFLGGDSTNTNTGWKGGSHALLEQLLGRRLYWGICQIHTNELPLRHLIINLDGPTSSDRGFRGPVCSLLSVVNEMPFNPSFRALPIGEDLITMPEDIVNNLSTDQMTTYKLVKAVKSGYLPKEMQEMQCGPLCHARWLTTAQRLVYMWTREHGLTGEALKVLEMLVSFCITSYFKLYFDIKVKHHIVDAPYHVLTSLRILKSQPKMVKEAITFYVRKGAWYAHSECLLLSLLSSTDPEDRKFGVEQILNLRGGQEYGDNCVRPRITPKLNLSATSLSKLITCKKGEGVGAQLHLLSLIS